ncbi:MAG: RluA family pseudouridine synthase, partial [Campylobacterales bacterium]|nr:RluA family pseudouridine synthase [Campylobacterales bacterium]
LKEYIKGDNIDINVDIIHEDDDILVVNKPPFLTVHDAPSVKEHTLVDWLKYKQISLSTISGEERHGIVHRLDKQTSGCLVVAKNNKAHESLSKQLESRCMGRYYLAIIDSPLKDDCIIEKPIDRNPANRLKMGIVENGRYAKSAFKKLCLSKNMKEELIAIKLFTGRTHQIRVHLSSLNRHILGDSLYGFKSQNDTISRVYLHAFLLYLIHPTTNQLVYFKAPLFDDMNNYLFENFDKEYLHEILFKDDFIINSFDFLDKRL